MVTVYLACALGGILIVGLFVFALRRKKRKKGGGVEKKPTFTTSSATVDPVGAALQQLSNNMVGAPTVDMAAHPQTGDVYFRRKRGRVVERNDTVEIRQHLADLAHMPGSEVVSESGVVGRLDRVDEEQVVSQQWRTAVRKSNIVWLVHMAETTTDPVVAAAAWTLAAKVANTTAHPSAADMTVAAAEMGELVAHNPHLEPFTDLMRHTVTVPSGQRITVTSSPDWLYVAAAEHACAEGDHRRARAWLRRGRVDDAGVEVLRIVEQFHIDHKTPQLPNAHLTDATSAIVRNLLVWLQTD